MKIVLKKSPKTGKQWITQTSKSKRNMTIEMKTCKDLDVSGGEGTIRDKQTTNMVAKQAKKILVDLSGVLVNATKEKSVGADLGGSAELRTPPDGSAEASPSSQPVITPHSETAHPAPPVDQTQETLPTDSSLRSCTSESSPSPPPLTWTPTPKSLERTLHLAAFRPDQAVKRPTGSQPVVVLNHPDADIPEVSRIMEVVKKYKGEIHKVVLSKRTLKAMDGRGDGEAVKSLVRERFLLKLKLRRLSRKKFEVVNSGASSIRGERGQTFRCWFCGRAFGSRQVWLSHRQRHLLEWKSPNCEN